VGREEDLKLFLPFQKRLKRLWVYGWYDEARIDIPSLKDLKTNTKEAVLTLIPGGSVESLSLNFDEPVEVPSAFPDEFLAGLRGLSVLTIGTHAQSFPWLTAFADHLENVRILDFSGQEVSEDLRLILSCS
jgi:hypothetical protein